MPAPKDIIGVVKELQEAHDNGSYLHCMWTGASENPELQVVGKEAVHLARLHNSFPAVAQALLIAVKALEEIKLECGQDCYRYEEENNGRPYGDCCVARHALSRIRSL